MIAKAIITSVLAALAVPAMALTPLPPCDEDAYGMSSAEYADWDNGLVLASYYWRGEGPADEPWKETAVVRLIDCKSGDFILLSRPDWQKDRYNLPEQHARIVDQLAEAEKMTLAQFRRKMTRAGAIVSRYSDNEESCSCREYFPELRGDKTPFRGTNG
ncbi:hypothetical protein RXV86_16765 [Alisedimentitalea sp. MJ-SS2]|uniref:hypothetical protein n=1 Tax=Aliisedimentitalea sp. MJ-SS2 TaxID=3049795 RepID=UPI002913B787|nr:hypothetical protein [Alisedimentitalea sp. MJ-SS2]MDU8929048.1 hypothetical protein [Alisedimentitalea sp. MJ-SS2]